MAEIGPKDNWDKTDILGKLLSALLVPFALVVVGQVFSNQAALRDESRRQMEREAEEGRRKIDRVNTLIESLSSESVQRRRLAVEWATYLDAVKELPPQVAAVLLRIAVSDPNPDVARSAANVTAEVAIGNATIRGLAAARLGEAPATATVEQLTKVVDVAVRSSEGVVSVPPCRASRIPFAIDNCDRSNATVVDVCTNGFPKTATIRATRIFTKWAGDPRPWDQAEASVGNEGDWNVFERTFTRDIGTDQQQRCATFRHWSSHQERVARIEVTYTAP